MYRLETLDPNLVLRLKAASPQKQREATAAACQFIFKQVNIQNKVVQDALTALLTKHTLSESERVELKRLTSQLDHEYWQLQTAVEEGRATREEMMLPFGQARAIAALVFASDDDPLRAALESIYEAAAAIDARDDLLSAVSAAL